MSGRLINNIRRLMTKISCFQLFVLMIVLKTTVLCDHLLMMIIIEDKEDIDTKILGHLISQMLDALGSSRRQ